MGNDVDVTITASRHPLRVEVWEKDPITSRDTRLVSLELDKGETIIERTWPGRYLIVKPSGHN